MTSAINIRSVLACDDIRTEQSGKLIAIGIVNPFLSISSNSTSPVPSGLRLCFILSLDVPDQGEYPLVFKLRGIKSSQGQTVKIRVTFSRAVKQVPLPIGPFSLPLIAEERGFKFQQQVAERWQTLATWQFENTADD